MSANPEPARWQREWQAEEAPPDTEDLKSRVMRETRQARIGMLAPVIVTVVAGGSVLQTAIERGRPDDITLAVGVWCFILIVWLGSLWIGRGTWRPATETTSEFLRLSIRRCHGTLSGIYFGAVLYIIGFLCVIGWRYYYASTDLFAVLTSKPVLIFGAAITPVVFTVLWLLTKRKWAELNSLLEVQRQLEEH